MRCTADQFLWTEACQPTLSSFDRDMIHDIAVANGLCGHFASE